MVFCHKCKYGRRYTSDCTDTFWSNCIICDFDGFCYSDKDNRECPQYEPKEWMKNEPLDADDSERPGN